jgi:excisionase family DNA binding protein
MLTVKAIAERLGISESIVYGWIADGLPHYRLGRAGRRGHIRIREADLESFLATMRREGRATVQAPPPRRRLKLNHLKMPS